MKILFSLTYYRPHVSGLTIYVQRLAEALAARGHQITVLTSQYDETLSQEEQLNGVRIVRVPVAFWVSKGAIMPSYATTALPLLQEHDVTVINLPNTPIEALLLPLLARIAGVPMVAVYHCDVQLPDGVLNRIVDEAVFLSNMAAGVAVDRIVAYTDDYAEHSRLLRRFPQKRVVIPPPVIVSEPDREALTAFRQQHAPNGEPLIGFAARFATEKGVEYMLGALPRIREEIPDVRVLFAGEYENVIGEEKYWKRLQAMLKQAADHWEFLGVLDPEEMAAFYRACDVTVLPSINSTESFGLVQVESMLCGTPVVASNLPGVRVPVRTTQMGRIVPIRDAEALAEALIEVIRHRQEYVQPRETVERHFSLETTVQRYETLFEELVAGGRRAGHAGRRRSAGFPPSGHREPPRREKGDYLSPNGRSDTEEVNPERDYLRAHLEEVPAFRALLRGIECRLFEEAGPLEAPVLDLGCGDGHFASMAFGHMAGSERGPALFSGFDPDEARVREAQARGVYRYPIVASATGIPYPDAFFNTVVANCVLEHIPDVTVTLQEAARVLRPGGRLLFGVPSHHFANMLLGTTLFRSIGMEGLARAYGEWFNQHSAHYHTDDPETWCRRLEEHGFTVESWRYYMSPAAHKAFDLAHYLGVPRLISRKLTGHWVAFANPLANALFERWLRPHYEAEPADEGPYIFFEARRGQHAMIE